MALLISYHAIISGVILTVTLGTSSGYFPNFPDYDSFYIVERVGQQPSPSSKSYPDYNHKYDFIDYKQDYNPPRHELQPQPFPSRQQYEFDMDKGYPLGYSSIYESSYENPMSSRNQGPVTYQPNNDYRRVDEVIIRNNDVMNQRTDVMPRPTYEFDSQGMYMGGQQSNDVMYRPSDVMPMQGSVMPRPTVSYMTPPRPTQTGCSNGAVGGEVPKVGFSPTDSPPGGLTRDQTPMFVYFSFDDAVTPQNYKHYVDLFDSRRRYNPNGCPLTATLFVSHNHTDYRKTLDLYRRGFEVASHSITHQVPTTVWEQGSKEFWRREIAGQRSMIHKHTTGGIPLEHIRGMRAPFLSIAGDNQYSMLEEEGFLYDSSIPSMNPAWPYTMEYGPRPKQCKGGIRCPSRASVWQIPMNTLKAGAWSCPMVDGCPVTRTEEAAFKYLIDNFMRYQNLPHKPPFGLNMHAGWFQTAGYKKAMEKFLDYLTERQDIWVVPIYKMLQWISNPVPADQLSCFTPFTCQ